MKIPGFARCLVVGFAMFFLAACSGGKPRAERDESGKIPVTTVSVEAREAFLKGRQLLDTLRATDARQYFVEATELDPDFALAHLRLANTATTNAEFFEELERAKGTMGLASDGEQMLISALAAAVDSEPEVQRELLEDLVAAYPEDERSHNALAIFLFGQQEYAPAIAEYRAAIAINPDFSPPYNQLGYALRTIGDFAGAEEAFEHYVELIPDQPNPYDSYAELLMKMGRFEESIDQYRAALGVDPNFVASYVGIANNQMFMGRTADARATLDALEGIARNDGERRQACTWKAVSYLYDRGPDSALAEAQRRFDIAAETDDRGAMVGDLNFMGNILLENGAIDEALARFRDSVQMAESADIPDEVKEAARRNHLFDTARCALAAGDADAATTMAARYAEAVAVNDVRFEVQQSHELNAMLEIAAGNEGAALLELDQANQLNPRVMLLRARALQGMGDLDDARSALHELIDFNQLSVNLAYVRPRAREMVESL